MKRTARRSPCVETLEGRTFLSATLVQQTGATFGTPAYNNGANTAAKATDGSVSTFFDAAAPTGGFVAIDLGTPKRIDEIEFAPRAGWASRMQGGIFEACTSTAFGAGTAVVNVIGGVPGTGFLSVTPPNTTAAYRYWRYVGPTNGYSNIAEFQLYTLENLPSTPQPPTALSASAKAGNLVGGKYQSSVSVSFVPSLQPAGDSIIGYYVNITDGTNLVAAVKIGNVSSATVSGFSLKPGGSYYVKVETILQLPGSNSTATSPFSTGVWITAN